MTLSYIISSDISDHRPVLASFDLETRYNPPVISRWIYTEELQKKLVRIYPRRIGQLFLNGDVNAAYLWDFYSFRATFDAKKCISCKQVNNIYILSIRKLCMYMLHNCFRFNKLHFSSVSEDLSKHGVAIVPEAPGTKKVTNWRQVDKDEVRNRFDRSNVVEIGLHGYNNNVHVSKTAFRKPYKLRAMS